VWLGDINRAVAHPELFLSEAKTTRLRTRSGGGTGAATSGPKRIVAVTACPTVLLIPLWRLKPLKPKRKTRLVGES
jgi:PTS system fructose-specific IIC component